MKSKLVILSLLLSGATIANAQTKEKYYSESWKDNFFISVGVGGQVVTNPSNFDYGFGESITPLVNISLGKFFSPVWGIRGQVAGWSGKLHTQYPFENVGKDENWYNYKKKFVALNADAMLNLTNLFCGYKEGRKFEFMFFVGPTLNISNSYSTWNLSSQLDVNHTVIIDASATNLEEDGTRTGNFNFLHYFLSYRLSVSQSVLSVSQVSLSLSQFASVLIDYGKKRTGIAVSDTLQMIANGLTTVPTHELLTFILDYVGKEPVERILVGLPKQMNNEASENMKRIEPFVRLLKKKLPAMPVEYVDERFTSVLAHRTMLEAGLKKKDRQNKALVDEISATIILQSYLENKRFAL